MMQENSKTVYKYRWLILFNVVLMTFMCCLDSSIVNVALPIMANRLNVSMAAIGWVVTSYLIIISSTILIFGRLGDIKGKTKIFKFGIVVFTFGSLLCGISTSLPILVIARVIQAIGAGGTMATSQGIITQVFPSNERGRALGISGTFVALGTMVGPPVGGFIVSMFSWKYIFLINVPIGIITFLLSIKILPKVEKDSKETLDISGAVLFVLAIVLMFSSLTSGQNIGFNKPIIILGIIGSLVAMVIFISVEKKIENSLLDLNIFRNKLFSLSLFCAFISFIAISTSNIILPFYLQDVLRLSPSITGIFMMVSPMILAVVAPISGYVSDKIGSEFLTFVGLCLTSVGLLFMSTLSEHTSLGILVIYIAIMTLGNGMFQSPNNSLIMSTVSRDKLGVAGSINALTRNIGMICGISLSTTILYSMMSHKVGYHVVSYIEGRNDVFIYGMRWAYLTAAIICATGAILTAIRLYGSKNKAVESNKTT